MSEKGSKTMSTFTVEQVRDAAHKLRLPTLVVALDGVVKPTRQNLERADMLDAYAETLEQVCETCRFAGKARVTQRLCSISGQAINWAPLTVNGQPFGCRGWIAKSQPRETGAPMNEGPLDLVDGITGRAGVPRE